MLTGREARWIQAMALVSSWSSSPACSPWLSFLRRAFRSTSGSGAPCRSRVTIGMTLARLSMMEMRVLAAAAGQAAAVNSSACS